jgi:hypothetical protein
MKEKNFPDYYNSKTLEELTSEARKIIEELEKKSDLKNSLDDYHKLVKLNNFIEKNSKKNQKK